jgi:type IV secretion system protein VirB6
MMTLGLVLTFATSWVAYQSVVWALAVGGPDQIASVLLGSKGSATELFAGRVDILFNAIAEAAGSGSGAAPAAAQAQAAGPSASLTPTDLMWVSALMLLLGTVGVLVTARIALAAMLALGPIFIVFALFAGTRGLFEGWLKATVMLAVTPLFAILLGAGVLELAIPVVRALNQGGEVDGRTVGVLFVLASVYIALMVMAMKAAGAIVAGWRLPGSAPRAEPAGFAAAPAAPLMAAPLAAAPAGAAAIAASDTGRARMIAAGLPYAANDGGRGGGGATEHRSRTIVTAALPAPAAPASPSQADRNRGLGSRFRPVGAGSFKEKRP